MNNHEQEAMSAAFDALERASDRSWANYEEIEHDDHIEWYEMAAHIHKDRLVLWEVGINERLGEISSEVFKTAREYNDTDTGRLRSTKWTCWKRHDSLEEAIETAIEAGQGIHPRIEDVRLIVANMTRDWVQSYKGISWEGCAK